MNSNASRWAQVSGFCLFVGYGRSGHSLVGSLIDAHPHAAVSHELNAVKRYFDGITRDVLFDELFALSQAQARAGRQSPRAGGGTYPHRIEGQLKPGLADIKVIGDKKGAGTARQFAHHGWEHISDFQSFIGVPVKMLHVIRNPFDIVAAGMAAGRSDFQRIAEMVAEIRRRCVGENWLDVYYEQLIANPRETIAQVLMFLGLDVVENHLDHCAAHLFTTPHRRRFEATWPAETREMVEDVIARHDYFGRYSWDS